MTEPSAVSLLLSSPYSPSLRSCSLLPTMDHCEPASQTSTISAPVSMDSSSDESVHSQANASACGPVRLYAMVRRFSDQEKRERPPKAVFASSRTKSVRISSTTGENQIFEGFDNVFDACHPKFSSDDLYAETTAPLVNELFDSPPSNGLLIVSGEKHSGKSTTMHGEGHEIGIFRRVLQDVFQYSATSVEKHSTISIALVVFYENKIFDLLSPGCPGKVLIGSLCSPATHHFVVSNCKNAITMLRSGLVRRKTDVYLSFGHLVLSIRLTRYRRGKAIQSHLALCDLSSPRESTCKKAFSMNRSLVALDRCLEAKSINFEVPRSRKPVPIRLSKFTRLFRPHLIGSGTAVNLLHLSPCVGDADLTRRSLTSLLSFNISMHTSPKVRFQEESSLGISEECENCSEPHCSLSVNSSTSALNRGIDRHNFVEDLFFEVQKCQSPRYFPSTVECASGAIEVLQSRVTNRSSSIKISMKRDYETDSMPVLHCRKCEDEQVQQYCSLDPVNHLKSDLISSSISYSASQLQSTVTDGDQLVGLSEVRSVDYDFSVIGPNREGHLSLDSLDDQVHHCSSEVEFNANGIQLCQHDPMILANNRQSNSEDSHYSSPDELNLSKNYLETRDPIVKSQILDKAACLCNQSCVRDLLNVIADEMVNVAPRLNGFEDGRDSSDFVQWVPVPMSEWIPDKDSATCLNCNKSFHLMRRRHHCRSCGLVFCYECCKPTKVPWSNDAERICQLCVDARRNFDYFHDYIIKKKVQIINYAIEFTRL